MLDFVCAYLPNFYSFTFSSTSSSASNTFSSASFSTFSFYFLFISLSTSSSASYFISYFISSSPTSLSSPSQEEDNKNTMDPDRRQASLERKIQFIETEIERQEKARAGVLQLAKVYQEQPDFVDEKGANNVNRQLIEVRVGGWVWVGGSVGMDGWVGGCVPV